MSKEKLNKPLTKPVWTAIIILVLIVMLGLASTWFIFRLFPSEVALQIKQAGITATIVGGSGLFLITVWLYSNIFLTILKAISPLIVLLSVYSFYSIKITEERHITTDIQGTQGTNKGTTINVGKNEGTINPTNNNAETIHHEEYKNNSRKTDIKSDRDTFYTEGDIIQTPSYRDATIVRGDNGNPVGVMDNLDAIQNATALLEKLMRGENVNLQEALNAAHPKFFINSGTEVAVLESRGTDFAEFVKVKILEGTHKDEIGWIHAVTVHHGQRQK